MPTQPTPKHGLSVVYSTDDALMRAAWYDPTEQQVRLDQVPVGTLIRINASPINGGRMHTWYLEKVVVDENDPEIFCRKAGEGAAKKFEGDGPYAVEDAWSFEEDETVQIIQISCLSP